MNHLVNVLTFVSRKRLELLARVEKVTAETYTVRYLSPTKKLHQGQVVYRWDEQTENVPHESISGFYETDDITQAGYVVYDNGTIVKDEDSSDEDYVPSDEDDDSDSESCTESESESENSQE